MALFLSEDDSSRTDQDRGARAREWGKEAEEIAVGYLMEQGVPITERNWKAGNRLEIDIISQQGEEMVFIEVKARSGRHISAEDAVDADKIRRIVKAADIYLRRQEHPFFARFDVVLIEGTREDHTLTYIPNAFYPPLITRR